MGNAQSLTRTGGALDSFVAELGPDLVFDKSLGSARFLKTVKCAHRNGFVVVKIFIKPDPGLSLRSYSKKLKAEREALLDLPNVYGYQAFVETERAGYIVRQWVASNLYDRISTRPFLSTIEKKWISFQLLSALRDARMRKVAHGDVKSENVLVTSWNAVFLSDFAPYKPTYLPLDDPADFAFFFDTSGRRTCYLAPERFFAADDLAAAPRKQRLPEDDAAGIGAGRRDGKVTEAMDVFGAGCVLAELFRDGAPLFTLAQLFRYRAGELSVDTQLGEIEDEGVRDLIKRMIALDPAQRPSFDVLLHTARGTVLPEAFYAFLHNYVSSVTELPSPSPFAPAVGVSGSSGPSATLGVTSPVMKGTPAAMTADDPAGALPGDSDNRMDKIWTEYESLEAYFLPNPEEVQESSGGAVKIEWSTPTAYADLFPVELHIPGREGKLTPSNDTGRFAADEDGPALIILSLICANIRTCRLPSARLKALDLFLALCPYLTDEAKLDRTVPYVVELLQDDSALVRAAAVRTLIQITMLVAAITPINAALFPEYVLPRTAHLARDTDEAVRATYARCLVPLADTAVRFLEMGQALRAHGAFDLRRPETGEDDARFEVSYDASLVDLQATLQQHLATLLIDPAPGVKRAVLADAASLCVRLGPSAMNDVLLAHTITYLNDRDWLLRAAFFESVVDVAACAGGRSLEEYILPLMVQALSDVEETVVAQVLGSLTSLCELGLFQKMRIWELMGATLGFLYHPNVWIRQGAVAFMTAAAKQLPSTDVWCILYPSLRHFLKSDVHTVDELSLLMALKPPLPRAIFDAAVQWGMRADNSIFWKGRKAAKPEMTKESMMASRSKAPVGTVRNKSEEDEANLTKLRQLGMTAAEEAKLVALRDYMAKLAQAISSFPSRMRTETDADHLKTTAGIELQKLKVVPQTIFLKVRGADAARSSRASALRRMSSDQSMALRSPASFVASPRPDSWRNSVDSGGAHAVGAPFEDLRRRLATINATSPNTTPRNARERLPSVSLPLRPAASSATPITPELPDFTPPFERPGSPSESVVSTANSSAFRAMHRLQVGALELPKAAPAVGSSRASATGLLEPAATIRSEGSPERSGQRSPGSVTGTLRGKGRTPSIAPISTYDGQEPGISHVLEHMYLDGNRDLQSDFGPAVHEGPIRRRTATRQSLVSRDGTVRRPEATLISHLNSHSDAITCLAVSPDHMFFMSGSDDGTVKVWDTARLERNVTAKPRHTYGQHHARVKALCMLEGTHCFASAAEDGSLHVVRVHVTTGSALPKYGKLQVVREHRVGHSGEWITCMTHFNTESSSTLIYATTHSLICVLDLRTMRVQQTLENARQHGPITALLLDRKHSWVLVGTVSGALCLWDLRFGLLLRSWRAGGRVHALSLHPTKGRGRWAVAALQSQSLGALDNGESTLAEVWDVERGALVERFVARMSGAQPPPTEPTPDPFLDVDASPAAAIAALVRARQTAEPYARRVGELPPPSAEARALVLGTDFGGQALPHRADVVDLSTAEAPRTRVARGFMLTGSEDRKLRLWDLAKVERTAVLSGLDSEGERPAYQTTDGVDSSPALHVESSTAPGRHPANRNAQRLAVVSGGQAELLRAHQDTITALATLDAPFRAGIVSGDRAGVVKVWRVDGAE